MICGTTLGDTPVNQSLLGDGLGNVAVGGSVGVNLLQKALRDLAVKAANSNVDPAAYDGTLTLGTVIALANTGSVLGKQVHPTVGKALDIVKLLKKPFEAIPYGSSVINIILSPWLIDNVYEIILAIIRLFPGGGSVATGISNAVKAFKGVLATAASPLAGVIALATTKVPSAATNPSTIPALSGLGETVTLSPTFASRLNTIRATSDSFVAVKAPATSTAPNPPAGYTWAGDHWERLRVGQTPVPGPVGANITIRTHATMSSGPIVSAPLTAPMSAAAFIASVKGAIKTDHRPWPKGKPLAGVYGASDWDESVQYSAVVPLANLYAGDRITWQNLVGAGKKNVENGTAAFRQFTGKNAQWLGAFYDKRTSTLKIRRVTKKKSKKGHWYDPLADIVEDIADFVESSWDWVKENADDVYAAVKKYSCLVVNNDIVVAAAAGAAGIVATPAASATVVTGAAAGRAACTALTIGEAIYAVIKFLSMGHPPPPSLTGTPGASTGAAPTPGAAPSVSKDFLASRLNLKFQEGMAGFSVVMPPTPPDPALKPSQAFPMPPSSGWTTLTNAQITGLVLGGLVLGGLISRSRVIP